MLNEKLKVLLTEYYRNCKNEVDFLIDCDKCYEIGEPKISDTDYDKLKEFTKNKFPQNDYFKTIG